jgi:hypothetical protein
VLLSRGLRQKHAKGGLVLGVRMALLTMALQYVTLARAGLAGGAYLALQIGVALPIADPT